MAIGPGLALLRNAVVKGDVTRLHCLSVVILEVSDAIINPGHAVLKLEVAGVPDKECEVCGKVFVFFLKSQGRH